MKFQIWETKIDPETGIKTMKLSGQSFTTKEDAMKKAGECPIICSLNDAELEAKELKANGQLSIQFDEPTKNEGETEGLTK